MRAQQLVTEHWSLLASRRTTPSEVLTRIPHDDRPGSEQTYIFFRNRRHVSRFLGGSMVFIAAVNTALAGLLTAAVVGSLAGPVPVTVGLGALAAGTTSASGPAIHRAFLRAPRTDTCPLRRAV